MPIKTLGKRKGSSVRNFCLLVMLILDIKNIDIEIIPYDGTPNPRNPFDRLTPEERHKKIVEIYAQIYLKMVKKNKQNNFDLNKDQND